MSTRRFTTTCVTTMSQRRRGFATDGRGSTTWACWWMRGDRMIAAGVALALATALKPQVVLMVPVCLLVAGRWRPVVAWGASTAVLAAFSAATLGPSGLADFWSTLQWIQTDGGH